MQSDKKLAFYIKVTAINIQSIEQLLAVYLEIEQTDTTTHTDEET